MKKGDYIYDLLIWIIALGVGLYLSFLLGLDYGFWGFLMGAGLGFSSVVTIAAIISKLVSRNRKLP